MCLYVIPSVPAVARMEVVHPVHQLQYHGAKIPNIDCWASGRADDYLQGAEEYGLDWRQSL